jgi:alpha-L-fucosidase 2
MLDYYGGTQDRAFLCDTLLPVAGGVAAFFDQHWKRDEKGKIRFEPACSLEACHSVVNPLPEIAGLKYILPRLLALPADATTAAQRAAWSKTLADLPEIPIGGEAGKRILLAAEVIHDRPGDEIPELYAVFPYRLYSVGCPDLDTGVRTFEKFAPAQPRNAYPYEGRIGSWRQVPVHAAFVGKTEQAAAMAVSLFAAHHAGSRFPAFWGPGHDWMPDQCHGGIAMMTLQSMLLQADGRKIYLFPAWPKDWDVSFKLHAPYNTTVEGELRDGSVTALAVTPKSRAGDVITMLDQ